MSKFGERQRHQIRHPLADDSPAGMGRATGVDDPTPREEYHDEPERHDPADLEDWCDLCTQAAARMDATVHLDSGPIVLALCTGCQHTLEDRGRSADTPQGGR